MDEFESLGEVGSAHPIELLSHRYPQLLLPIEEGTRTTPLYRELVLRGGSKDGLVPQFSLDDADTCEGIGTPAGVAEVLCLRRRDDFEHAVRALAYRCEPEPIPASMGAITISGLIDWGKIRAHERDWLAAGNDPSHWTEEFSAFSSDRANIRGTIIILSSGPYSAVPARVAGEAEEAWLAHSLAIRKYHELAHFTSRSLFPENMQVLRDEVLADYVGLVAAYGHYEARLALTFLGLEGEGVRADGRLVNYLGEGDSLADFESRARSLVAQFLEFDATFVSHPGQQRHFDALLEIETQTIGLSV